MDLNELQAKVKAIPYWYHRIELPGGVVTPGWAPIDAERYCIPKDLTGKRVLDIGAWDGYWTWEALRRGAREVVAIDDFSDTLGADVPRKGWETFDLCREAFGFTSPAVAVEDSGAAVGWCNKIGQRVQRVEKSVYTLDPTKGGTFDVVFFFGTIYHLKHPMLALEKIAAVCDGEIYIESAVCDDYSPYRGGLGKGFSHNEVVMEFYPGRQYGNNPGNWWAPTLQCLGGLIGSVGFQAIEAWPLTESPKTLAECRGFVYGSKTGAVNPKVSAFVPVSPSAKPLKVAAVMSVPRLGFQDNSFCVFEGLVPLGIPLWKVQGAFWGQCLERGIQTQIDNGADVILTIDYDTLFKQEDVTALVRLMEQHPEAAAIVPIQVGRGGRKPLMTVKGRSGQQIDLILREEFEKEVKPIATGHFGLTLLRTSALLELPHPWFHDQPDSDGQWGKGRIDADIWFWKQLERAGKTVLSANRVVIGHMELMASWPDTNFETIYQVPEEYHKTGKPANCWK